MALSFDIASPAFKGANVTSSAPAASASSAKESGALLTESNPDDAPVTVQAKFASVQHGSGCGHCMGYKMQTFSGRPSEVKSAMASAASASQGQNFSALRANVVAHEGKHYREATIGPGSQHLIVGAPNIDDAAIAKAANGEGGGTLGSVSIQPPSGTPKSAAEAKEFADAFRTMGNAASAVGSEMSDADKSVAASGAAGASEMEGKAAQLETKEGQGPQVAQGNASKADPKKPSFSISA